MHKNGPEWRAAVDDTEVAPPVPAEGRWARVYAGRIQNTGQESQFHAAAAAWAESAVRCDEAAAWAKAAGAYHLIEASHWQEAADAWAAAGVPEGTDGAAFHTAMILLDLRSTAAFGIQAVVRDEKSILYRRLAGRLGLAGGGACMWALDWFLAWVALPAMLVGTVPDPRASGLFLLVLGAIHAFGWLSNRSLRRRNAAAAAAGSGPA